MHEKKSDAKLKMTEHTVALYQILGYILYITPIIALFHQQFACLSVLPLS